MKQLLQAHISDGVPTPHFFEGRVLTGRDLRDQQSADSERRRMLGRGLGAGIVSGFEVTVENIGSGNDAPEVRVGGGLAINAEGQTVALGGDYVTIALSRSLSDPPVDPDLIFAECDSLDTETLSQLSNGAGLYVLVAAPAAEYQGFAPMSGLQDEGVSRGCGRRYLVDGVRFRLLQFPLEVLTNLSDITRPAVEELLLATPPVPSADVQGVSRLRNLAAHLCFGTPGRLQRAAEPFGVDQTTALSAITGVDKGITACDVPLALIYWGPDGITFLDNWAVKRRLPSVLTDPINGGMDTGLTHTLVTADAMTRQFQAQVWEMVFGTDPRFPRPTRAALRSATAEQFFYYLPPVGVLPIATEGSAGFFTENFFAELPHRRGPGFEAEFIDAQQVEAMWQQAALFIPVAADSGQLTWVYRTLQHAQHRLAGDLQVPVVMFASGFTPPQAVARFDLARWDYSHYMRCC